MNLTPSGRDFSDRINRINVNPVHPVKKRKLLYYELIGPWF